MVSPLAPANFGQVRRINPVQNVLAGMQAGQNLTMGQQAIDSQQFANERAPAVAEQNDAVFEAQRVQQQAAVINRLAKHAKQLDPQSRDEFLQSRPVSLFESIGIDPQMVAGFKMDDQSLDNLIAQTEAILSQQESQLPAEQRNRQALMNDLQGGIDPATGRLKPLDQLTVKQRAAANELGLTPKAGTATASERIAADPDTTSQVADSQAAIAGAKAGASEAAKLDAQLDKLPQVKRAVTEAQERIKNEVEAESTARKNAITLNMYDTAMQGVLDSFQNTDTGPVAGRLPAVTTEQQIAEGAVSAMAPILKSLFRTAGEGTFTDKDQELLMNMVPTRKDTPEAVRAKMQNIDAIVKAKLGMSAQPAGATPKSAPSAQPATPGGIKFLGFE